MKTIISNLKYLFTRVFRNFRDTSAPTEKPPSDPPGPTAA